MGIMAGAGLSKDEVNYRQHEKCMSCGHFYGNSCDLVSGNISSEAVCNRWEIKDTRNEGKDGDFYKEQLAKVGGEAHVSALKERD